MKGTQKRRWENPNLEILRFSKYRERQDQINKGIEKRARKWFWSPTPPVRFGGGDLFNPFWYLRVYQILSLLKTYNSRKYSVKGEFIYKTDEYYVSNSVDRLLRYSSQEKIISLHINKKSLQNINRYKWLAAWLYL